MNRERKGLCSHGYATDRRERCPSCAAACGTAQPAPPPTPAIGAEARASAFLDALGDRIVYSKADAERLTVAFTDYADQMMAVAMSIERDRCARIAFEHCPGEDVGDRCVMQDLVDMIEGRRCETCGRETKLCPGHPERSPSPHISAARFGTDLTLIQWLKKLAEERNGIEAFEDAVNLLRCALWLEKADAAGVHEGPVNLFGWHPK